ncbi:MAG: M23 family metallopeptidase [Bacterioplanes sp.]|nr:M23 family metallopeptidase [Bacterioplanes sp.]
MNIIIVGRRHGQSKTYTLSASAKTVMLGFLFALPFALGVTGYLLAERLADEGILDLNAAKAWERDLVMQRQELQEIRKQTDQELVSLTIRLAELQGKLLRLDALGERLVDVTNLQSDEFDFSIAPALGGPLSLSNSYQSTDISQVLNELAERISHREQQLEVLDSLMSANRHNADTTIAGRPVRSGWMSSRYGQRTDPFSGRQSWHAGVDFAAKAGSDVIAAAGGVVTFAGRRHGYGLMVEINHGNGYKTRYAHHQEITVNVGDIVRRGDTIALVGSSGRSTGPHVHYEVYKNGRTVDPAAYINRKPR